MKTLLLTLMIFTASAAQAELVEIKNEPAQKTELKGFFETLYGKRNPPACFTGSSSQVCSEVRSTVSKANKDLSDAGATQRFNVVACAQNPNRAMVIFSVKKSHKTVIVPRCDKQQIELIVAR